MFYSKLIFFFYLFLTVLAIICPVKITFFEFLPGIGLMWLLYFIFNLGTKLKVKKLSSELYILDGEGKFNTGAIFFAILHVVFYPIYIKFYTGSSVLNIINALNNGMSTYAMYQENFKNANLNQLSLSKLPLIFGHGILKFFFIFTVFRIVVFKKKILKHEFLCMFIMIMVSLFVGISRGTSFELFEIVLLFLFAYSARRIFFGYSKLFSSKTIIIISLVFIGVSGFFAHNINVRMGEEFSFFEVDNFDKTSFVYQISKPLSLILFSLNDYFLFGLYFNSTVFTRLWFASVEGFLSFLIPSGFDLFKFDTNLRTYVNRFIEVKSNWEPDSSVYILKFGIIITLFMIFFIGFFSKYLYSRIFNNISALILLFYIFYFFISLPVGNFITVSSASQISIFIALLTLRNNFFGRWLNEKVR